MSYTHFSLIELSQLEILYRMEWSNREIGEKLGRHYMQLIRSVEHLLSQRVALVLSWQANWKLNFSRLGHPSKLPSIEE